jgi:acetylornithine deacetylase/succinyl-diaminopimelate desuccinylase-like protein
MLDRRPLYRQAGEMTRQLAVGLLVLSAITVAAPPPPNESAQAVQRMARRLVGQLVAVETVAANETKGLEPAAELFRQAGVPFQVVESAPGRGNLIARLKGNGTKRPLLLLAHIDVVPVGEGRLPVRTGRQ